MNIGDAKKIYANYIESLLARSSNRLIYDFLSLRIPIKFLSTPVRLCGHNRYNRMREAMVHVGIRFLPRLHGLEPVRNMNDTVIPRTARVWRLSTCNLYDLLLVTNWGYCRHLG